jgi:hypothetical protein
VIQRVEKALADGKKVDVDETELGDAWAPRVLDSVTGTLHIWKRKGTNPQTYNDDTFYSENDGPLIPLTAKMVNDYWDEKYPGFTRSGNPDPTKNCQDYAYEGHSSYTDGTQYDLNKEGDQSALEGVLGSGKHVLQLGSQKVTAHFVIANHQGGGVRISQKDGDSAIYYKDMTAKEAVAYLKTKHSTIIEQNRS